MDNNKIKQGKPIKKHMTTKKLNKYVLYELKTRNKMQNIICIPKTKNKIKKEITNHIISGNKKRYLNSLQNNLTKKRSNLKQKNRKDATHFAN